MPVGVSVNEALLGACLSAADLGYRLVLPRDAVAGVPEQYVDAVIEHTLAHGQLELRAPRLDRADPAALHAFDDVAGRDALAVLAAAPRPRQAGTCAPFPPSPKHSQHPPGLW